MKTLKLLLLTLVLLPTLTTAQTKVTGTVRSFLDHQPLAGANVIIKGTTIGVITDASGVFAIEAKPTDTLVFSFIGYESQAVAVAKNTTLDVSLAEGIGLLQEIAVYSTGYQDIPAERSTGSFALVDNALFNRRVSTNVIDRIEDVTSGVLFNRGNVTDKISIRGRSTIFANADPLIVIDNFPYDGSLDNINPNDVENITVLKDAAAASIWGARAGNGVIVITTKKGARNMAPKISVTSNVTIGEKPDQFYVPRMSVSDYIETEKTLFASGYYTSAENSVLKEPLTPVVEWLIAARDGKATQEEATAQIEALKQYDVRNDYDRYLYQKSISQQYAINIGGGTQASQYYLAAGYDRNKASLVGEAYERFTLNARNTWSLLKDKLQVSAQWYLTNAKTFNNGLDPASFRFSSSASNIYPYARFADDQVIPWISPMASGITSSSRPRPPGCSTGTTGRWRSKN